MYYLKMGTEWVQKGNKTGTGRDHEAKNRIKKELIFYSFWDKRAKRGMNFYFIFGN